MRHLIATIVAFLLPLVASSALADVITLQPIADTSLYSEAGDRAGGGDAGLFVGITNLGNERRCLLRFDLAGSMPAGSVISDVSLSLSVNQSQGANFDSALHAISAAWTEGTTLGTGSGGGAGGAAVAGDTTWTRRVFDTIAWATLGGDFAIVASASSSVPGSGSTATFAASGMVADAQSWLDTPANNFGWIMVPLNAGNQQARRFSSKEDTIDRPQLTVTFTPPVTTGACCADSGACTVVDDPGNSCTGIYQGLGVACSIDLCPAPTGACCLADALASCLVLKQIDCEAQGGSYRGDDQLCVDQECPVVLQPYVDALPIPRLAVPLTGQVGGEASYKLSMVQLAQKLHRDLPLTKVWGYDDGLGGSYPGPTLLAGSDLPVEVIWANDLRDDAGELLQEHALPVDTCPHGADDASARSVTHLHGGHVPAAVDGYPESTILPGESVSYVYPNKQDAATLWYHDHALGITRLNVYMGLAGFYIINDAEQAALNLPSGAYDVPLVVQDRSFAPDGSLRYPVAWVDHVVHNTILVNGKVWPFMNVDKGKYRFRVLNGSGTRTYRFRLSDGRVFQLIGSDGGLLPAPVDVSAVVVAPGERVEIVIDFRNDIAFSEVLLLNDAPSPFPGTPGQGVVPDVMKFVVGSASGVLNPLPASLRDIEPLPQDAVAQERDFVLAQSPDPCSGGNQWLINGLGWHDITERPELGTTEIWRFINNSGMMHPMHMHLVFFQVIERQAFDLVDGQAVPTGELLPLAATDGGWQDTVQVLPGEMVRVIAKFEDYTGLFAYHCHILEHEDNEMMRQFETFTNCGDGVVGMPDEECDDGGESVTCNEDCTLVLCGDGILNVSAGESCDDGNTLDGDLCDFNCLVPLPEPEPKKDNDGGCGCNSSNGGSSALVLMLLGVVALSRRRLRWIRQSKKVG